MKRPSRWFSATFFSIATILILVQAGSPVCQAAPAWRPGQNMRQSMIRLLAPTVALINQSNYGFSDTAYLGAFLRPGNYSFLTMTLNAGETYVFIGAGDTDVRDLDILVEDSSGRVVAQDTQTDSVPVVRFTPVSTQRYTLKLKLYRASVSCFCGVALLRKQGWSVPARNLDVAMDNMLANCENVAAQRDTSFLQVPGEWAVIGTIIGEGQSSTFSDIQLGKGRRAVTAGGDSVSRDIDLTLFEDGASPRTLDEDADQDASPLVECVANYYGRYGVVIRNAKSRGATLIFTALLEVS